MTLVHYTAEVKSGLLLELPAEARALHLKPGDKVAVQLDADQDPTEEVTLTRQAKPNEEMLAALHEIAQRQQSRRYTDGSETDRLLREGRAGAMWGYEPQ